MRIDDIREDLGAQIGMAISFSGKTNKQIREETGLQNTQIAKAKLADGVTIAVIIRLLACIGKRLEVVDIDNIARELAGEIAPGPDPVILADEIKIMDRAGKLRSYALVKE